MTTYICATCGVQYPPADAPPATCLICSDERQWVPFSGQRWLDYADYVAAHHNLFVDEEPDLLSVGVAPAFAINQRALVVRSPSGNVLWDCVPLVDDQARQRITALGGLRAIALSHPHYLSAIVEWSQAFGGVPIYLHHADREWVTRPYPAIRFWEGSHLPLWDGLSLVHCGGHFPGSAVLHWPAGADGRGVVLAGDTLFVLPDQRHISMMYSFPNLIPLPAGEVNAVLARLEGIRYDRVYSAFADRVIRQGAREAVASSMDRYRRMVSQA